jgi:hypothetical protein
MNSRLVGEGERRFWVYGTNLGKGQKYHPGADGVAHIFFCQR